MVWACFSSKGVGRIVKIDGIMDKYQYAQIVEDNVRQSAKELGLSRRKWIFQQDNGNHLEQLQALQVQSSQNSDYSRSKTYQQPRQGDFRKAQDQSVAMAKSKP